MLIRWVRPDRRFFNGFDGYLGEHVVAQVYWNGVGEGGKPVSASIKLPGATCVNTFVDEEAGRTFAENMVARWLEDAGIEICQ